MVSPIHCHLQLSAHACSDVHLVSCLWAHPLWTVVWCVPWEVTGTILIDDCVLPQPTLLRQPLFSLPSKISISTLVLNAMASTPKLDRSMLKLHHVLLHPLKGEALRRNRCFYLHDMESNRDFILSLSPFVEKPRSMTRNTMRTREDSCEEHSRK